MLGLVPSWSVTLVLVTTLLLANLPFANERLFAVGPRREPKSVGWRLIELLAYALVSALLGRFIEGQLSQPSPIRWEFVAVWLLVVLTLAFPGFVWRYLKRQAH